MHLHCHMWTVLKFIWTRNTGNELNKMIKKRIDGDDGSLRMLCSQKIGWNNFEVCMINR